MHARARSLSLAFVACAIAASAHAAPWAPTNAAAIKLAREGKAAYERQDYEKAAERFEAAWSTEHANKIGLALAQSYRKLGQWKHAIELYDAVIADASTPTDERDIATKARDVARMFDVAETYVASGQLEDARRYYLDLLQYRSLADDDRQRASRALDDIARREADKAHQETVPPPITAVALPSSSPTAASGTATAPPTELTERVPWYRDRVGMLLGVTGLVAGGVGTGFLWNASSLDNQANSTADGTKREQLHESASTRQTIGTIAAGAGAALFLAGAIKLTLFPASTTRASLTLAPGPGDVGLGFAVHF